jgi:hypothetical protein
VAWVTEYKAAAFIYSPYGKRMNDPTSDDPKERLRARVRQLILMRETGPKRAAWHHARARLIWRLHDELRRDEASAEDEDEGPRTED